MGTRFWEFYLVRYLLGTIFAIVILFYLVINYNDEITKSFLFTVSQKTNILEDKDTIRSNISSFLFDTTYSFELKSIKGIFKDIDLGESIKITQNGVSVLAAIIIAISGFLYMYFSSMIILVAHGIRSVLFSYRLNKKNKPADDWKFTLLFWSCCYLFIIIIILLGINIIPKPMFIMSIIIIIFSLIFFIYPNVHKFYQSLSFYRSEEKAKIELKNSENYFDKEKIKVKNSQNIIKNSSTKTKEYIESYKHLREHGNAFGIIVCEIIFAGWLILWDFSFWAILCWCLIGFSSWILGSYLEVREVEYFVQMESVKDNSKSDS